MSDRPTRTSEKPLPVWIQPDRKGFRVYLTEKWYKFYMHLVGAGGLAGTVSIASAPNEVIDTIIEVWTEVRNIVIEFGLYGWRFTICVAALMLWLLRNAVSVGEFAIHSEGSGYGRGSYGGMQYGGGTRYYRSIVREAGE